LKATKKKKIKIINFVLPCPKAAQGKTCWLFIVVFLPSREKPKNMLTPNVCNNVKNNNNNKKTACILNHLITSYGTS